MNQIEKMATQQHGRDVEKAFVLWDMGNCPIPDGHDPLTVVRKIQAAVEKSGHVRRNGQISITAIGHNLAEIPGEDVMRRLSSIGVSFKHSYHYQHDLNHWAKENPPPGTMMIIDSLERIGWIAARLCLLEDDGFSILLAYPQRDIATPFQRPFCWDWDALVSHEQETTTTTSLFLSVYQNVDQYPWSCEVCFVSVTSLKDFTAHLKSAEHEFGEWDRKACKENLDRTDLNNLPFGQSSKEMDLLLLQDLEMRLMMISSGCLRPQFEAS